MTVAQMSFGFLQFILSTPLPVDRGKLLQDDACNSFQRGEKNDRAGVPHTPHYHKVQQFL